MQGIERFYRYGCVWGESFMQQTHNRWFIKIDLRMAGRFIPGESGAALYIIGISKCIHEMALQAIDLFVQRNPLFQYVEDKRVAVNRLRSVYEQRETRKTIEHVNLVWNRGPMTIQDPVFEDPHFEEIVILTHMLGQISLTQVGTAFYWKSALQHYGKERLQACPLFCDGNLTKEAQKIIGEVPRGLLKKLKSALNDTWFSTMKGMPASETTCLYVGIARRIDTLIEDYHEGRLQDGSRIFPKEPRQDVTPTVADFIYATQINLFNRIHINHCTYRVIPSVGMVEAICRNLFPEGEETKMAFRFGMTQSLRENGLLGERDIALQSTFARLPDYADGFWAPLETFTSHDLLYHMIIVSCIPDLHKKLIIGLADAMRRIGRAKLADMYEDMECLYYLAEMSPEEAFMNSIADIAFRSVRERRDEAIAKEYIKRAFFEMRCLLAGRQENPFCREVFKYLREDAVELLVSQDPIKGLLFFPIKVCD